MISCQISQSWRGLLGVIGLSAALNAIGDEAAVDHSLRLLYQLPQYPQYQSMPGLADPFSDYPSLGDHYVPFEEPGYFDKGVEMLLDSRESVSQAVNNLGQSMDAYFAGRDYYIDENESYMLLRMSQRWEEAGNFEPEFDYKFRLDLPGTKERYRLVLESEEDDDDDLEQRNRPSSLARRSQEQSFLAGLMRTVRDESGRWEGNISGGIKVKLPPDPFVRTKAKRYVDIGEDWKMELQGRAEWRNSDGVKGEFDIIMDRIIVNELLFRTRTAFDWREENDTLQLGQIFSIFQSFADDEKIEYQLAFFGDSLSKTKLNTYYLSAIYRKLAYKDWLFINIIPELAFERENEFSSVASITAGVEIYFD